MDHIYQQEQFGEDWFDYQFLYSEMVKNFPDKSTFIEIGSWKGKSAAYMAVEIANSGKRIDFICVDTFLGNEFYKKISDLEQLHMVFKTNMLPLENYYRELKMSSLEASVLFKNESVDFIFIDACHEYESVKADILAWKPKVKKGGILAGHDYGDGWPGVSKAVNELLANEFYTTDLCWVHKIN